MARHKGKINAVMIGVGAAFPVYAGLQSRAPKWMQDFSLEWLHRLFQEPRRLFWRYTVSNTLFLWLILGEWLHRKRESN
jgi:N-acetylglucosaminyldiphosphoundecaprenol N-acetyl-beta-D-mannosaminyltransferase